MESDLDPNAFLQSVRELKEKRQKEDQERNEQLEAQIMQDRELRQARKLERERSLSPEKTTPQSSRYGTREATPVTASPISGPAPASPAAKPSSRNTASTTMPSEGRESRSILDRPSSPSKASTGLSRSGTMSWQKRPGSISVRNRPLSAVASENNAARSPQRSPERAVETEEDKSEVAPSKDEIAKSLGSKDPTWFRQTPDRGLSSPAYRSSKEEPTKDSFLVKKQLPGMTRDKEEDTTSASRSSPPPEPAQPSSPSRITSVREGTVANSRPTSMASISEQHKSDTKSPLPTLDSSRFVPPGRDRSSTADGEPPVIGRTMSNAQTRIAADRPVSPTKGMGGFVQSAFMKRTDSVNKRWSATPGSALNRQDSTASIPGRFGSVRDNAMTASRSMPSFDQPQPGAESQSRPGSSHRPGSGYRPGSSHSTISNLALAPDAPPAEAPAPTHSHSRSRSVASISTAAEGMTSPPLSPSKRWSRSPTKSSWLESALARPESPKPSLQSNQPSWMAELSKAKQQKSTADSTPSQDNIDATGSDTSKSTLQSNKPSWMANISKAKQQRSSGEHTLSQDTLDAAEAQSRPKTTDEPLKPLPLSKKDFSKGLDSKGPDSRTTPTRNFTPPTKAKPAGLAGRPTSLEVKAEAKETSDDGASKSTSNPDKNAPSADATKEAVVTEPVKPKPLASPFASPDPGTSDSFKPGPLAPSKPSSSSPQTQTEPFQKKDFRAGLRSRTDLGNASTKDEPEFRAVFGKLKKAHTDKYVAPDELKDNILRGKAGLNLSDGPQKRERKDELRDSLIKKKEEIKLKRDSDPPVPKVSPAPPTALPEALTIRKKLGRSDSTLNVVPPEKQRRDVTPEALSLHKTLRNKNRAPSPEKVDKTLPEKTLPEKKSLAASKRVSPSKDLLSKAKTPDGASQKPVEKDAPVTFTIVSPTKDSLSTAKTAVEPPDEPAEKQPEKPTPNTIDEVKNKPNGKLVEKPWLKSTEKPAPQAVEKPWLKPTERPAPKAAEKPWLKSTEKPALQADEKPLKDEVEKPTAMPSLKPTSSPEKSEPKAAPLANKFADRFNPALAGLLARGLPSIKPANSNGPLSSSTPARNAAATSDEPASDVQLTHMTKNRAKGPKRRKPNAKAADSSDKAAPTMSQEQASKVIEPAKRQSQTAAPLQPPPKSAAVRTASLRLSSGQFTKAESPTTPDSTKSLKSVAITASLEPSTATSSPKTPPKSSLPPSTPSKSASLVRSEKPELLKVSGSKSPSVNTVERQAKLTVSKEAESDDANKENRATSVKSAASMWGKQAERVASRSSPIQLPTKKDEEAAMKSAGLLSNSPLRYSNSPPLGLGISKREDGGARSPSSGAPPPPPKSSRVVSASLSSKDLPSLPDPRVTQTGRCLMDHFGDIPFSDERLRLDTQAILKARPGETGEIKTLRKTIQEITGDGKLTSLPAQEEHILYEDAMYVCTHVFGTAEGTKVTEVYLWAGNGVSESAIQDAQIFAKRIAKEAGAGQRSTQLLIIDQNREPPAFFQALGGIVIVRRGSRADRTSNPFMLCGRPYMGHVAFDEVELSKASLCSDFPYIVARPITLQDLKLYLWKGNACGPQAIGSARLIGMDLSPSGEIIEVEEGKEPQDLLLLMSDLRSDVCRSPELWNRTMNRWDHSSARLFRVSAASPKLGAGLFSSFLSRRPSWTGNKTTPPERPASGSSTGQEVDITVKEISPFTQTDLEPEGCFVMDCGPSLLVLPGPLLAKQQHHQHAFTQALLFAHDYGILAASMEDRPAIPLASVVFSGLPREAELRFRRYDKSRGVWGTEGMMAGRRMDGFEGLNALDIKEVLDMCCKR
ncbi:hypothetical protein AAFC00_003019 [Neodothiora populina]|uniref:DUF4045 domain-containing protein n=1 Tax=Neodothiora populina TaxID=2781224 RepID=A0ABR3P904_9PEZI